MAKQLTIFLENKPGRLNSVTEILFNAGISVTAFTIQDRGDFGLMKLLVDKPDAAHLALIDKGFAAALKEVLVVSIPDKPGNLNKLAAVLLAHKINVVDTYGFVIEPRNHGVCCLEVADTKGIPELLQKEGFAILSDSELHDL